MICVGGTISTPLQVTYTNGVGIPTYQWYYNSVNSTTGASQIQGANSNSYTPPIFNITGNYYYYCEVSLSGIGCDNMTSAVAEIQVFPDPIVTDPYTPQELCENATPTNLQVVASGGIPGDPFTYQWHSNGTNSNVGGTQIQGATNPTYTPSTVASGTTYYYCVVQQNNGNTGCESVSNTATVIVTPGPSFNVPLPDIQVCEGATISALTVSYSNGVGTPSYQW